ncbi:unnamed protein product [Effrenium voratum]|nr:unnamed protein product [Effrenium voratum]
MDHFREYDKWPWQRFSSLERQLGDHPSFVLAEVLFISLSCFAFLHAACESNPKEGRRLMLIWFATFIVGTVNDYIFMLLPVVDNFWQAQGLVMLTPRMPLYIPCVYNAFMYWPTVSAARVFYHARQSALAEAGLAGLLAVIFYAPYDMCDGVSSWYTICGQPHADFRSWLGGLLLLCAAGAGHWVLQRASQWPSGTLLFVLAMSSKAAALHLYQAETVLCKVRCRLFGLRRSPPMRFPHCQHRKAK